MKFVLRNNTSIKSNRDGNDSERGEHNNFPQELLVRTVVATVVTSVSVVTVAIVVNTSIAVSFCCCRNHHCQCWQYSTVYVHNRTHTHTRVRARAHIRISTYIHRTLNAKPATAPPHSSSSR